MHRRPAPGRPRPVADPVVGALAERPDDVARRWLVALVEGRPLADAASVPVAEFARRAPGVCRAVLEAVGAEDALDGLAAGAAADDLATLSGSRAGPAVVTAAEALRRALREAAADELPGADADVLVALTDRLAHVCAQLAAGAMAGQAAAGEPSASPPGEAAASGTGSAGGAASGPVSAPDPAVDPGPTPRPGPALQAAPGAAPLWLAALERQLAEGGRFGLLLVELDGAERLSLVEGEDSARDLFARTGRAARGAVRRCDLLA